MKCPICRSSSKSKFSDYLICEECKTLFLKNFPSAKDINKNNQDDAQDRITTNYNEVSQIYINRLREVLKYMKGKTIMDVGYGNGVFMQEARLEGLNVYGIEKPEKLINFMRKKKFKVGKQIKDFKHVKFDAIVSFDVVEHVVNPDNFLRDINIQLKQKGIIMITTPNSEGISGRFMRNRYFVFDPIKHYILFSPKSIKILLERNGFDIIDISTDIITPWFMPTSKLLNKILNKAVYIILYILHKPLFAMKLGDNLQVIGIKKTR